MVLMTVNVFQTYSNRAAHAAGGELHSADPRAEIPGHRRQKRSTSHYDYYENNNNNNNRNNNDNDNENNNDNNNHNNNDDNDNDGNNTQY